MKRFLAIVVPALVFACLMVAIVGCRDTLDPADQAISRSLVDRGFTAPYKQSDSRSNQPSIWSVDLGSCRIQVFYDPDTETFSAGGINDVSAALLLQQPELRHCRTVK